LLSVIAAHAASAAQNTAKQALLSSTAASSNTASQSGSSPFDAILATLGLGGQSNTSSTIPTANPQTIANAGTQTPSGASQLTARTQKALANKPLQSLKVLTPAQASQLLAQAQASQAQPAQTALNASVASTSNADATSGGSSIGSAISGIESAIKGGLSDVIDALGVGSSTSPVKPPLAAPILAGQGNPATSKAQAQAAANTATAANSEALQMALAQAANANSAQDPDEADSTMDASALAGARITAAKNPTADQVAASKQQAFANLKPAADVKVTETQALQPDAGSSKADTKDTDAKSGGGGDGSQDNSQTASNSSAPTPAPQQNFQAANAAPQHAASTPHIAGDAVPNVSAVGGASTSLSSATSAASNLSVASTPDKSTGATLDTSSLAVTIAAKSVEGARQFNIRLDPPELGRVDVKLSVDDTGKAQAHLTVEKPQTLDMLQKDSGSLQRSLKESGVDLSNNGLQFSLRDQNQQSAQTPTSAGRKLFVNAVPAAATIASTHGFAHDSTKLDIRV
jgi:flagellar hook-length control protein FliK